LLCRACRKNWFVLRKLPKPDSSLSAGSQTLSVTFTPTNLTLYQPATKTVTLQVNPASTMVTWATPAPITYGTALSSGQLNATANVAGTFVYSPPAGTVLTTGSRSLSVTFTPTDSLDYTSSSGSTTLQVNPAATTVVWSAPAAITYGMALGAAQLNATVTPANAGTFAYTPTAGTILGAGSRTLSVTFAPTDGKDYNSSTGGTTLQVNPAGLIVSATSAYGTYGQPLPPLLYSLAGFVNGDTQGSATSGAPSEGTAASPTSTPGVYPIVISQGSLAATNYNFPLFVPGVLTLQQGASSVTVSSQSGSIGSNQSTTLTATVSVTGAGAAPTQTVNFMSGANLLGTGTLSPLDATDSTGTFVLNGSLLTPGANSITAIYGGDSNYGGSTSAAITVTLTSAPGNFGVGSVGTAAPAETLTYNFTSTATLSAVNILTVGVSGLDYTDGGGSTCAAGTTYNSGQSCTVTVAFTPSAPGMRRGAVILSAQGSTLPLATLYLSGFGQAAAVAIDPGTQSSIAALGNNGQGYGSAVDGAGNLYVADNANSQIVEIAAGTFAQSTPVSSGLSAPSAVALDGAGNLYISDTGNARVVMVPNEQGTLNPADMSVMNVPGLSSPNGLATDASGNLYIADAGNGAVIELPAGGGVPSTVIAGLSSVQGLAIDAAGDVYVTGNNQVTEYPQGGGSPTPVGSGFLSPGSVAVDPSGAVYVVDSGNSQTVRVVSGGSAQQTVVVTGISSPQNVSVDAAGNLYVTAGNIVYEVNRTQAAAVVFGSTGVGSNSAPQTVTVSNAGDQPLTISNLAVSPNFLQVASGGTDCNARTELPAAAQCLVAIEFAPSTSGTLAGTVSITDNALNQTASVQTVQLSGNSSQGTQTITFPAIPPQTFGAGPVTLNATASSGLPVSYAVTAGSATVSGNILTITGAGSITVQASQSGNAAYSAATPVMQTFNVTPAATSVSWSASSPITYGTALSATQLDATANVPGTFVYSPPAGTVLNAGSQTLSVTFTPTDGTDYSSSNGSVTLQVNQAAQTITFTQNAPSSAQYNTSFTVAATASSGLPVSFGSSGACSNAGTLFTMTSGTGTCSVMASQSGNSNYVAASPATQSTAATPAAQSVTFTGAPASAPYQSTFVVVATTNSGVIPTITASGSCSVSATTVTITKGSGTCSLTAKWAATQNFLAASASQSTTATKATPTVTFTGAPLTAPYLSTFAVSATTNAGITATITASGTCSASGTTISMTSGTGKCSMTAKWAATTNYLTASALQSTTAVKLAPTLTWATPSPIIYGTALSGTQLNATANTAGSFAYSPVAGTVLAAGNHNLTVTFTPTLTQNYLTGTAKVVISVNKTGTTTTIASNTPNPSTVGKAVKVQFNVVPASGYGTPTGHITLSSTTGESCTATLNAGAGSCSVIFNTSGSRTLTASYGGDVNDNTSVSVAVTQSVN